MSDQLFDRVSEYIDLELRASLEDYEFIKNLNKTVAQKFSDFQVVAERIGNNVNKINKNHEAVEKLNNLFKQIDMIEEKVTKLESMAYKVDNYSKRLEERFKQLDSTKQK